jgi:hypothetical protein
MKESLIQMVAEFLAFDVQTLGDLAAKAQSTYRHYKIPKKRGGERTIYHPSKTTKGLQYALMHLLKETLPPHECAKAFVRGLSSPLRKNAEAHAGLPYTLRIDFKDFFPSIRPDDLVAAIEGGTTLAKRVLSAEEQTFLTQVLFVRYRDGLLGLPIGAPSSPMVSNAIMRSLDESIQTYALSHDFVYTRYADDLIFSTAAKGASKPFLDGLREIVGKSPHPKLTINEKKTLFMSRNSRRAITGLIISPDGTLSIGRSLKRRLRALVNDFQNGKLQEHDKHRLQGYLAFVLDVEPGFYNRLCQKYTGRVLEHALKQIGNRKGSA